MASSSVSQEDVENDFEVSSRRSRIRSARARVANRLEVSFEGDGDGVADYKIMDANNEHDMSPKPLGRIKEKRTSRGAPARQPLADHVNRSNHMSKGKQQRDRRKLREKRRSTGVVHLQSTESTGGSTGEEDEVLSPETKKNTLQNEQLIEDRVSPKTFQRTKSPSDLDADDEDNQNQSDSTVSSLVQIIQITETSKQQRSDTPTGESSEEQLERLREENGRLVTLLEEKDKYIVWLENRMKVAQEEANLEKMHLKEEVAKLMRAMTALKTN